MTLGKRIISLQNIGVRFPVRKSLFRSDFIWPLEDVSLTLHRGETLGVIGRNGAGKSTLLRLMAGIIEQDRGIIEKGDVSTLLLSLQVGFQANLTGRENAFQSGILLGMTSGQVKAAMDKIIEFAEIEDHIDRPVKTYSVGMRARLGFAVAVQSDPDILLIDEVLGVGDRAFREKSREHLLARIKSDETVVVVSHHEDTLRELCDRLVWIEQGITRMEGPTEEVLAKYLDNGKAPQ